MKKTLMTCLAIIAVFAIASTAGAVTCTIDQRPAATLLVPYFQVSYGPDGNSITTGVGARDTIVTIIQRLLGADDRPRQRVRRARPILRLDFNIALTGFDVQPMRVSDILSGFLPVIVRTRLGDDACQRNPAAESTRTRRLPRVTVRWLRRPATGQHAGDDATYPVPAFGPGFDSRRDQRREDCDGELDLPPSATS